MERVGEHPVPAGPLAVRWLGYRLPELRAGAESTVEVALRNAGTATWRARRDLGVRLSYHWLDDRGNAIVWDGPRVELGGPVAPGDEVEVELRVRAPQPPGRYRLAFDLVEELRFWFAEVGSTPLELDADVRPRIDERRLAVVVRGGGDLETTAALAAQEEPLVETDAVATAHLVAGAVPAADWSRRILDAHAEGYAAVGGSIETRDRALRPWAPGGGRNPAFSHPLLLPSLLHGLEPGAHEGLPAYVPAEEPAIFDGRIRLRLPRGRRRG
ncbi:MAG: hypothetical protein HOQ03_12395 [Thermoleophilia bacterium]|nr:hypothetical protein [Thermoleophilia bacterium]